MKSLFGLILKGTQTKPVDKSINLQSVWYPRLICFLHKYLIDIIKASKYRHCVFKHYHLISLYVSGGYIQLSNFEPCHANN